MATPFTFDALVTGDTVALDASAGTGKTHTLTAIALRLIAEGKVTIEQLLIVTFTNAATAELKLRLASTLKAALGQLAGNQNGLDGTTAVWLTSGDADTINVRKNRIQAAIMAFDDASIVTIHGFCQRMLTFVGVTAGLPLDAAVTDDDTIARDDTLDDIVAGVIGARARNETLFLTTAARLSRKQVADLARQVLQLSELRLTNDQWQDTPLDTLTQINTALDEVFTVWRDALATARTVLPQTTDGLEPLVSAFLNDPYFAQSAAQNTYKPNKAHEAAQALAQFFAHDHPVPPVTVEVKKKPQPDVAYMWFTQQAVENCQFGGELPQSPLVTVGESLTKARDTVITQARNILAHGIWQRYQTHRANRQVMTYDDLLRQLHDALIDPERAELTRMMLRTQFTMALIDEFQDTDAIQWGIFSAVFSPADPLVVIGDPKQAIYQFRGADVATYLRARDTMRHVFTLDTNWRSDTDHVAAINTIFTETGAFEPYGITYQESHATHQNRLESPVIASGVTLRTIEQNDDSDTRVFERIIDDMAQHAVAVLTTSQISENGVSRPATPRDLAVLVRANFRALQVQAALQARGIPATIQRGGSVYTTNDAQDVHQLLAAIVAPHAIKLVCGAAASSLFQLPAPLLAAIQDGTATRQQDDTFQQFAARLIDWQNLWRQQGVFAAIMAASGHFAPSDAGERTLINVRHLAELLATAATEQQLGPDALIAWFAQQRAEASQAGYRAKDHDELRLDAQDDAVRIATVHGAKGLEYPLVFVGDLWHKGHDPEPGLVVYTDPDATPHPKPTLDLSLPIDRKADTWAKTCARRDNDAEQVRLAYVALTRAAHATVIWCPDSKPHATAPLGAVFANQPDEATYPEMFARLATHAPIVCVRAEGGSTATYQHTRHTSDTLTTRTQQRIRFDTPYRHTSFSALTRHNDTHASVFAVSRSQAGDDDRDAPVTDIQAGSDTLALASFPRGTRAGNLLHSVFEHLDFETATIDTVRHDLEQATRTNRFDGLNLTEAASGIINVLDTPLGATFNDATLRQIPRHARADEMTFTIPLATKQATVTLRALAPILNDSADPLLRRLANRLDDDPYSIPLAGYLSGSIDCLMRLPCGRYVVVDYKSNFIGDENGDTHLACYAPTTALANTMNDHLYTLQALLYLAVTDRYLTHRIDGYQKDTHLAGAAYLFLRGMIGPTTPHENGYRYGVATITPEPDVLDAVNQVLAAKFQP